MTEEKAPKHSGGRPKGSENIPKTTAQLLRQLEAAAKQEGKKFSYTIDDEGNGYQRVDYCGSVYYAIDKLECRPDSLYCDEDLDYIKEEGYLEGDKELIPVCVVN